MNITLVKILAKLSMAAIIETIRSHAKPIMTNGLPNKRFGSAVEQ